MLTTQKVMDAVRQVEVRTLGKSLGELQAVYDVRIQGGRVFLQLRLPPQCADEVQDLRERLRAQLGALPGVEDSEVTVRLEEATPFAWGKRPRTDAGIGQVKRILAVGSGKGGVGKSTVTILLAQALAFLKGQKVGILDADIWGPSLAEMLGVKEDLRMTPEQVILPVEHEGMKVVTLGTVLKKDQPVVWRGPMAHKALEQFFQDTRWGDLDVLLVDLPPGTGDVAISVAQVGRMNAAIVVTSPQEVSVLDVRKAVAMFRALEVPVLGIVENFSYFVCPSCGTVHHIFGKGGGKELAAATDLPLLAQVPLVPEVREAGDLGRLYIREHPDSEVARLFRELADVVLARVAPAQGSTA